MAPVDELERVPAEIAALVPAATARRLRAIPLGLTADTPPALRVALRDPHDRAAIQHLETLTGHVIVPVEMSSMHLGPALDRIYANASVAPPPAPAASPARSDDWRRIEVTDGPASVVHGRSMAQTLAIGLVVSALGAGAFFGLQAWRWDRAHQGTRYYGDLAAPDVGISFSLDWTIAMAPADHGPGFAQYTGRDDARLEFRRIPGTSDRRTAARTATERSRIWDHPIAFSEAQCTPGDELLPRDVLVCHSPAFHQWALADGEDTIVATFECSPGFPVGTMALTIESIRARL